MTPPNTMKSSAKNIALVTGPDTTEAAEERKTVAGDPLEEAFSCSAQRIHILCLSFGAISHKKCCF